MQVRARGGSISITKHANLGIISQKPTYFQITQYKTKDFAQTCKKLSNITPFNDRKLLK